MSYWKMKRRTENYKKALGRTYRKVSDELISTEEQHINLNNRLKKLKDGNASEEAIAEVVVELGILKLRYRRLFQEFASQ